MHPNALPCEYLCFITDIRAMVSSGDVINQIISGSTDASIIAGNLRAAGTDSAAVKAELLSAQTNAYSSTMNGLVQASKARDMAFYTTANASRLGNIQASLATGQTGNSKATKEYEDTYRRQFEINEWSAANRQETLFVFQFVFFAIVILTIIASLYRTNIVGGYAASAGSFATIFIMVMIIVYRSQYTAYKRDKRHWNKRRFDSAGPIFSTPNCPAAVDFITNLPTNLENAAETGITGVAGLLGGALTSVGNAAVGAGRVTSSFKF